MKKTLFLAIVVAFLLMAFAVYADQFEMLTINGVTTFTASKIKPGLGSDVKTANCGPLESAEIRFTVDGTTPTTTVGHLLETGQTLKLYRFEINGFQAIKTGAANATLPCTYEFE